MYNENGDLVTENGMVFRQVGWQINGGENDHTLVRLEHVHALEEALKVPHGGYSPVYVQIGD